MGRKELGKTLKVLRNSRGLTQAALADELGISSSAVSMYERGEREPDFDTLNMIANYFGVSMSHLLGEDYAPGNSLLESYEALNDTGKKMLIDYLEMLLSKPEYRKEGSAASAK